MLNLKYKLYKSNKTKRLTSLCITACFIWNHCIAIQRRYYRIYGKYVELSKMRRHISKHRRKNEYWKRLNSQSVQEIVDRVDLSYIRFFKGISKRPPKFRKLHNFTSIIYTQSGYKLIGNIICINKIGKYKFSKSREYDNVRKICIKKDAVGDFYLVLCCDIEPKKYEREGNSSIGLDFGLKHYLTLSTGEKIESPLFYNKYRPELVLYHKKLSNKQNGSKGKTKSKSNLCKVYRKIENSRQNNHWILAHSLCRKYGLICIEDLNIASMKKIWGRKISDVSYSTFIDILQQCARKYNTIIKKIDRYYPSSKLCRCGYKNDNLKLIDRLWTCPCCGETHDRDVLAAKNILGEGIRLVLRDNKTGLVLQS